MTKGVSSILFLCTGNSCRSQMAEGFARKFFPSNWNVYSAGTRPMTIHPLTIEVMKEAGVDVSKQYAKGLGAIPVDEIDLVITLCGDARDNCPIFPRPVKKEHWPIPDPYDALGTDHAKKSYEDARDEIKKRMEDLAKRLEGE